MSLVAVLPPPMRLAVEREHANYRIILLGVHGRVGWRPTSSRALQESKRNMEQPRTAHGMQNMSENKLV